MTTGQSMVLYLHSESPAELPSREFDRYLEKGWYRMHQHLFTLTHLFHFKDPDTVQRMDRVWWLRFRVDRIRPHASHRRLFRSNRSWTCVVEKYEHLRVEDEDLYSRYRASINFDGYPSLSSALYGDEASRIIYDTWSISILDGSKRIALGLFDLGENAAASMLHFYDPDYARHSLGRYLMLLTVQHMKSIGYAWYYPGYVIAGQPKLNYKLFLGREAAQYFNPELRKWKPFKETILTREVYSEVFYEELKHRLTITR